MIRTVHGFHSRFGRALAALGWPADARRRALRHTQRTGEALARDLGERFKVAHLQAAALMRLGWAPGAE